jgi:hypothetical protein
MEFNKKEILKKRLEKLNKHYIALKEYKELIDEMEDDIYDLYFFENLGYEKKAILEAYLKRFASIQDFLGAKIFPIVLELSGIIVNKMSEVLINIEKEEIIDSISHWIEIREIRNELEHDYPDDMQEALKDLRFCINNFVTLESYYFNSINFIKKYIDETI